MRTWMVIPRTFVGGHPPHLEVKGARARADPAPMITRWWDYRRHARNGRVEVACAAHADHLFWLSNRELATWKVCPHCVGWITHWPGP